MKGQTLAKRVMEIADADGHNHTVSRVALVGDLKPVERAGVS